MVAAADPIPQRVKRVRLAYKNSDFQSFVDGSDILVQDHATGEQTRFLLHQDEGGYASRGGGDVGLMRALHREMTTQAPSEMRSSISQSVQSHLMAFAAEKACRNGTIKRLAELLE